MRLIIIILLIACEPMHAQLLLQGKIMSAETGEPLEGVVLRNLSGNHWAVSGPNGGFRLELAQEHFKLEVKLLGKKTLQFSEEDLGSLSDPEKSGYLLLKLQDDNLRLEDVVVTAVPKSSKVGSAIRLGTQAVEQVQSFSVADILKQLPGQMITPTSPNPLNKANFISLRTVSPEDGNTSNNMNAFGVSFLLDGVPLSNDENMQSYNTSRGLTDYDNLNSGIDLRTIPAANIEEIEIISGIPDARYGNLTSGLIRIDRKAGVTPLTLNMGLRKGNTSVSLNKGFRVSEKLGTLSLSMDYLNANSDPRNSLEQYDRITAAAIWSLYSRNKKIRNTLSLTLHNNLDDVNYDLDNDEGGKDARFKKDRGVQLSNRFSWQPAGNVIDNFNLTLGGSYAYQHSYTQSFYNDGGKVVPQSMESGLFPGAYTPVAYLQIREVYGQPMNLNARTSFEKELGGEFTSHSLSVGLDASYSDNKGRGRTYDPENAHTQVTISGGGGNLGSGEGIRPLDYGKYLEPRINFGIYAQDNITHRFSSGKEFYANLGLRYDVQNGFSSMSPRVNLGLELSKDFSIRGGIGFATKAPSLAHIYPGNKYFDMLVADFRTTHYSFNLVQTYHKELGKQDLEPVKSWKYEVGLNYNPGFGNFAVTAFLNNTYDGITTYNHFERVQFPEVAFSFPDDGSAPSYEITGYSPLLLDYSLGRNALSSLDKGVEFYLNFKKWEAINTSFSLNGTYVYSSSNSILDEVKRNANELEVQMPYGIYKRNASKSDMIRMRGTLTHHLPRLGLLLSLTAEQFTRSASYARTPSIYPMAYLDAHGVLHEIPEDKRSDPKYQGLFQNPSRTEDRITPLYHNFHLRATKELLHGLRLSLYVTNFLNYRPVVRINDSFEEKNAPISFGANINYKF